MQGTIKVGIDIFDSEFECALVKGLSHISGRLRFYIVRAERSYDIKSLDVLMTDKEAVLNMGANKKGIIEKKPIIIRLTSRNSYQTTGSLPEIYRYTEARSFVEKIIACYEVYTGISFGTCGTKEYKLISFSSYLGGAGTTALAISCALTLSEAFGEKCVYIPISPIDSSGLYTGIDSGKELLSLMYDMSLGKDRNIGSYVSSFKGVDFITGNGINRNISEMRSKELDKLLSKVKSGEYGFVLIDVGNHIGSLARHVYEISDSSVMLEGGSGTELIKRMDRISFPGEKRIRIFRDQSDLDDDAGTDKRVRKVRVARDEKAFRRVSGHIDIDLRGRYGDDVMKLTEILMES